MARWRAAVGQHLRWSSPLAQGVALCVLTFGVVLPLLCHRLLYSYYFVKSVYLDSMSEEVLQQSYARGQDALRYWEGGGASSDAADADLSRLSQRPELLVTVITARRTEGRDFHYLLRVMRRLAELLRRCGGGSGRRCAEVLVCDVESGPRRNEDAALLEGRFRVARRESAPGAAEGLDMFEREKRDYAFCLRKGWELAGRPGNVVVLEDDALPRSDFFAVVRDLISRRFARGALYVKLYHPERLQRYWNPEPCRLLEWAGLGVVVATALLLTVPYVNPFGFRFSLSAAHLVFLSAYVMAVAELAGRHYLLELRRASPQLYAVSPATECCTPAMLFPGNASLRTAGYLETEVCAKGNAKDMVLYRKARSVPGERAHSLEPNLVSHIGAFSSVRPNPSRPKLL